MTKMETCVKNVTEMVTLQDTGNALNVEIR